MARVTLCSWQTAAAAALGEALLATAPPAAALPKAAAATVAEGGPRLQGALAPHLSHIPQFRHPLLPAPQPQARPISEVRLLPLQYMHPEPYPVQKPHRVHILQTPST